MQHIYGGLCPFIKQGYITFNIYLIFENILIIYNFKKLKTNEKISNTVCYTHALRSIGARTNPGGDGYCN